jgi:hypothetical protein
MPAEAAKLEVVQPLPQQEEKLSLAELEARSAKEGMEILKQLEETRAAAESEQTKFAAETGEQMNQLGPLMPDESAEADALVERSNVITVDFKKKAEGIVSGTIEAQTIASPEIKQEAKVILSPEMQPLTPEQKKEALDTEARVLAELDKTQGFVEARVRKAETEEESTETGGEPEAQVSESAEAIRELAQLHGVQRPVEAPAPAVEATKPTPKETPEQTLARMESSYAAMLARKEELESRIASAEKIAAGKLKRASLKPRQLKSIDPTEIALAKEELKTISGVVELTKLQIERVKSELKQARMEARAKRVDARMAEEDASNSN